jgi:DcmR-like sensory protein
MQRPSNLLEFLVHLTTVAKGQLQMNSTRPSSSPTKIFWGEIAPNDHIVHFYDDDETFLTTLAGYIAEGLSKRESVIIIATPKHLSRLAHLLGSSGVDLMRPLAEDRYIALDAAVALSCFMVDGWPNEEMFASLVKYLIKRASRNGRRIRAFGEMVALLWTAGNRAATVQLEDLWNQYCRDYGFCLLCSYPKAGFSNDPAQSIAETREICAHHTRFLGHADQSWPVPAGEAA